MARILTNRHDGSHTDPLVMDCPGCHSSVQFEYTDWVTEPHHSHERGNQRGYLSNYVRCPACQGVIMFGSSLVGDPPRSWIKRFQREESAH